MTVLLPEVAIRERDVIDFVTRATRWAPPGWSVHIFRRRDPCPARRCSGTSSAVDEAV